MMQVMISVLFQGEEILHAIYYTPPAQQSPLAMTRKRSNTANSTVLTTSNYGDTGTTWGEVGVLVLKRWYLRQPRIPKPLRNITGGSVLGLVNLDTGTYHAADDYVNLQTYQLLNYRGMPPVRYKLIIEGPLMNRSDGAIREICLYYLGADPRHLLPLICTCRRFQRIFTSDTVWRRLKYSGKGWDGRGIGSEEELWSKFGSSVGLPIAAQYRLRWMSHNASRLKLFYGSIPGPYSMQLGSVLHWLRKGIIASTNSRSSMGRRPYGTAAIQNIISVISLCPPWLSKRMMRQMHYLIPTTATSYHRSGYCQPLLTKGVLVEVEPSPLDSRSRFHDIDPGTRVECSADGLEMIRRIGDERLTFVQLQGPVILHAASWNKSELRELMWEKGMANTIILYVPLNLDSYDDLQSQLIAIIRALLTSSQAHKPLLLLLGTERRYRIDPFVQYAVKMVAELIKDEMPTGSHWYVQPFNTEAAENDLKQGFLAGWNWLIRTLVKKREEV